MMVRSAFACDTCGKVHTVRVGVGTETHHSFRFPCKECGEDIGVALKTRAPAAWVVAESNCSACDEQVDAPFVILDAAFPGPADMQGQDRVFPRLHQMAAMVRQAEAEGRLDEMLVRRNLGSAGGGATAFVDEWRELRRAWTLRRRGQAPLSRGVIKKASAAFYLDQPMDSLEDWLWRFAQKVGRHENNRRLDALVARANEAAKQPGWQNLLGHYHHQMAADRGRKYLSLLTQFFEGYSEFGQVHARVAGGVPIEPDEHVGSIDFERTRMFYGNAFELHAELIDLVAMLNNVIQGREFGAFASITLEKYLVSEKAGRSAAFAGDAALHAVAEEFDNRIRNASHHGAMQFDPDTQIITFRTGKGNAGPESRLTYAEYLAACVRMTMQVLLLMQFELVLSDRAEVRSPL
jgi:hypothetical protein